MNEKITEKIARWREADERYAALADAAKDTNAMRQELAEELVTEFREQMLDKIVLESGETVTARAEVIYAPTGGELKNPENKTQVIGKLVDLGLLDENDVVRFEGANVHASKLAKAFRDAPENFLNEEIQGGRLSARIRPLVKVTAKRGVA